MVILGYKTNYGSIIRALSAIGIGGVMVSMPVEGLPLIIRIIGSVLFAAGLVSVTVNIINRKDLKKNQFLFSLITSCIVAGIGLTLIIAPGILAKAIIVVAGLSLIIFGCLQMIVLGSAASLLGWGMFPLIYGALAVVGGIVIMFNPFPVQTMSIITGCIFIYYGISELISIKKVSAIRKEYEAQFTQIKEIDEQ